MKYKVHRFLTRLGLRHYIGPFTPWVHTFRGVRLRGPLHSLAEWLLGVTS